jgi:hypothetical protein
MQHNVRTVTVQICASRCPTYLQLPLDLGEADALSAQRLGPGAKSLRQRDVGRVRNAIDGGCLDPKTRGDLQFADTAGHAPAHLGSAPLSHSAITGVQIFIDRRCADAELDSDIGYFHARRMELAHTPVSFQ